MYEEFEAEGIGFFSYDVPPVNADVCRYCKGAVDLDGMHCLVEDVGNYHIECFYQVYSPMGVAEA